MGGKKSMKKKMKSTTSVDYDLLPHDLWVEILARIPFKLLLKFRSVSTSFRSIIDDPGFGLKHLEYSKNNQTRSSQVLIIEESCSDAHKHRCSTYISGTLRSTKKLFFSIPLQETFTIEGYISGLLLIQRHTRLSRRALWCLGELMVCNPSLRKSAFLPLPSLSRLIPCPSNEVQIGFGFDFLSNDHKVVVVKYPDENIILQGSFKVHVEILGLREISWLTIEAETSFMSCEGCKVFANGAIHWLGRSTWTSSQIRMGISSHIISFHLGNNTFSYKKLPDTEQSERRSKGVSVFVLRGSLALVDYLVDKTCIWTMEDSVADSWTKRYTIDLISLQFYCAIDDDQLLFLKNGRQVTFYDLESGQIIVPVRCRCDFRGLRLADAYVESLVWYHKVHESQRFFVPALTKSQILRQSQR